MLPSNWTGVPNKVAGEWYRGPKVWNTICIVLHFCAFILQLHIWVGVNVAVSWCSNKLSKCLIITKLHYITISMLLFICKKKNNINQCCLKLLITTVYEKYLQNIKYHFIFSKYNTFHLIKYKNNNKKSIVIFKMCKATYKRSCNIMQQYYFISWAN